MHDMYIYVCVCVPICLYIWPLLTLCMSVFLNQTMACAVCFSIFLFLLQWRYIGVTASRITDNRTAYSTACWSWHQGRYKSYVHCITCNLWWITKDKHSMLWRHYNLKFIPHTLLFHDTIQYTLSHTEIYVSSQSISIYHAICYRLVPKEYSITIFFGNI